MKKTFSAMFAGALLAGAALLAAPQIAVAGGDYSLKDEAVAGYDGRFLVRLRGIAVVPSGEEFSPNIGSADVSTEYVPELDLTYFFTKNIALEVIAAYAVHDVSLNNVGLGDTGVLPPHVFLQYHFDGLGGIKPYVGAGIGYIFTLDESLIAPGVNLSDEFTWGLQAGVDIEIGNNWYLNADVKKIFWKPELENAGGLTGTEVNIDPWIIGVGFGYRFGEPAGYRHMEPLK